MGFDPDESFMSFEHYYGQNFWRLVFIASYVVTNPIEQSELKTKPLRPTRPLFLFITSCHFTTGERDR
jgi:hypothetical protein